MNFRLSFLGLVLIPLLFACAEKPATVAVNVTAMMEGQPVVKATVFLDGKAAGKTNAKGKFSGSVTKMRNQQVSVEVKHKSEELSLLPWKDNFTIAPSDPDQGAEYNLAAVMKGFIRFAISTDGEPLDDASISLGDTVLGQTNAQGEFTYSYKEWPAKKKAEFTVAKSGYQPQSIQVANRSGADYAMRLYELTVIRVKAVGDRYGQDVAIRNASVFLDGVLLGRTNELGALTYIYNDSEVEGTLDVVAPGYTPVKWNQKISLQGKSSVQARFYPLQAQAVRAGIFGFHGVDAKRNISGLIKNIESEFARRLFANPRAFRQVKQDTLNRLVADSGYTVAQLTSEGWENAALRKDLDVLVSGHIKPLKSGYLVVVDFYRYDGKLLTSLSQRVGAGKRQIAQLVKRMVGDVMAHFPFAGIVTKVDKAGVKVNLGRSHYPMRKGDMYSVHSLMKSVGGEITGSMEVGAMAVKSMPDQQAILDTKGLKKGKRVKVGDSVIRLGNSFYGYRKYISLQLNKGSKGSISPLAGVNAYIDGKWAGVSRKDGKLNVPAKVKTKLDLVLYKPGYQHIIRTIEPTKRGQKYDFSLEASSASLTITSEPEGARVFVDGDEVGTTPIIEPYPVNYGFRTIKVMAAGDYRVWQHIIPVESQSIDLTGKRKIVLHKDHIGSAKTAKLEGKSKEAGESYEMVKAGHPDYVEARYRLGQLNLGKDPDLDAAIGFLEPIMKDPRILDGSVKSLLGAYTSLGQAYCLKGESLVGGNNKDAARYFAKAVVALTHARKHEEVYLQDDADRLRHDNHYYLAKAYHAMYNFTRSAEYMRKAKVAWQNYFDFFPNKLNTEPKYEKIRKAALEHYLKLKRGV